METQESALLWEQMDMGGITRDFDRLFPGFSFDGEAVFADIMQGQLWEAVKKLAGGLSGAVLFQRGEFRTLFFTILVLGVAAALFSNFADMFQDHQVSDLAFYFIYLLLITVLLKFFTDTAGTVREILQNVTTFIRLYIPTYILAVGSASGAASASGGYQILLVVVYLIEWGYLTLLLPFVHVYVLLTVINGIWTGEKLALLLELAQKVVGGSVKVSLWMITGFSLLQSMVSPVIDSLQYTAVKRTISAIPGLGDLTEGMLEMVMGSAVLVKNGLGLFMTLALIALCAIPILKIALTACVIKLSAALIGIISDKRLTNCVSRMGEGSLMLLKMAMTSVGMFVIQVAIITCSTGQVMR
ncbi:MAG: stage III sporulation protein AE [Lachnospiraceae bacterium]|nr:stage III sporulation protein AE [Lachnospiraceae bacterium]